MHRLRALGLSLPRNLPSISLAGCASEGGVTSRRVLIHHFVYDLAKCNPTGASAC